MAANTTLNANAGINKLANVLIQRMQKEGESPLCFDFGEIQINGSLITNTFDWQHDNETGNGQKNCLFLRPLTPIGIAT